MPPEVEHSLLVDRCGIDLAEAISIVGKAKRVRELRENGKTDASCSTRETLQIADLVSVGLPVLEAFRYVVAAGQPKETKRILADAINPN